MGVSYVTEEYEETARALGDADFYRLWCEAPLKALRACPERITPEMVKYHVSNTPYNTIDRIPHLLTVDQMIELARVVKPSTLVVRLDKITPKLPLDKTLRIIGECPEYALLHPNKIAEILRRYDAPPET